MHTENSPNRSICTICRKYINASRQDNYQQPKDQTVFRVIPSMPRTTVGSWSGITFSPEKRKKLLPNTEQPNYDRGSITELSAESSTTTAPSANNSSGVFTRTSMTRRSV